MNNIPTIKNLLTLGAVHIHPQRILFLQWIYGYPLSIWDIKNNVLTSLKPGNPQ